MDFWKWQVYLEEHELNGFHREDHFMAQIAYMIAVSNAKEPNKVDPNKFLIKFGAKKATKEPETIEEIRHKMLMSRAAWANALGVKIPIDDLVKPDEVKDSISGGG